MKAAIYTRVSTQDQEREGTSLDSQLEACLKKARELAYETQDTRLIREVYSGLTLDRPKLTELREWIRNKEVDTVIAYTLDRLSRDPVHLIILEDELDRAGIKLLLVTETIDSSDLGKLITYIKGYAAKLEAEKIKERTMRGKRARVEKYGKLPTGRGVLYGYNYDKVRSLNIANNFLDVVRMVGMWVLGEGIFLNEACRRLMEAAILAPKGGTRWSRSTLGRILRNPTYAGKTYAFKTTTVGGKRMLTSQENRVEVLDAVDRVAFTWNEWLGIQRQLDRNRDLSPRNRKLSYLLRGMVFCKRDGRKYYGVPMHAKPYYRCSGHNKLLSSRPCTNRSVNGEWLDEIVWEEVARILHNPELLLAELQKRRERNTDTAHLQERVNLNCSRLTALEEAETRYLRLYGVGVVSETKLGEECTRIRLERNRLEQENLELQERIREMRETVLDAESIKQICELAARNLADFTCEQKRSALEALDIRVWVNGDSIAIEGVLPIPDVNTVLQPL